MGCKLPLRSCTMRTLARMMAVRWATPAAAPRTQQLLSKVLWCSITSCQPAVELQAAPCLIPTTLEQQGEKNDESWKVLHSPVSMYHKRDLLE